VPRDRGGGRPIKVQEKQAVLGVVPNFYVSYVHNPVPLAPKQKFELGLEDGCGSSIFGVNGAVAGIQQRKTNSTDMAKAGKDTPSAMALLCNFSYQHVHRRRYAAFAAETGSALFLTREAAASDQGSSMRSRIP